MTELIFKDEVYSIIGVAMEVQRVLGRGFLEPVPQEAMEIESRIRHLPIEAQKEIQIRYKGHILKKFYVADLVYFGHVIVELKALDILTSREDSQILNYLKATNFKVGLLVTFGSRDRLEWKRFVM